MNDADKKVYKISNQDKVKENIGQKVAVKGNAEGDTIEVEAVAAETKVADSKQ